MKISSCPEQSRPLAEQFNAEIVYLADATGDQVYRATLYDAETGAVLGRRLLPGNPDGAPRITLGDIAEMLGGAYRLMSIRVDIETAGLSVKTRRLATKLRLRKRQWRRRSRATAVPDARPVAIESPLEHDPLRRPARRRRP
jgi:hypothetical protein